MQVQLTIATPTMSDESNALDALVDYDYSDGTKEMCDVEKMERDTVVFLPLPYSENLCNMVACMLRMGLKVTIEPA